MVTDLTKGSPMRLILNLSIPMILSAVLQQLYTTIDAIIVGNYVGEAGLAGVGISFPIIFLINSIMIGLSMGVSVIVGQYFGVKNYKDMKETMGTAMISLVIITLIISIVGIFASGYIIDLMRTPEQVALHANRYLKIIFAGSIFSLMYNLYSAVLKAVGDSKSPLLFLIIAAGLNVILDLVFIRSFGMGTSGAAIATVISQGISSIFCIIYIRRKVSILSLSRSDYKFSMEKFKLILRFGLPSSLQFSVISIGNIAIQSLVNSYGVGSMAGYTSAIRIDSFLIMPYLNIGMALSNYTSQNVGAGNYERVKKGLHSAYKMLVVTTIILAPIVYFNSEALVKIFLDEGSSESIKVGSQMLLDLLPLYLFLGFLNNTGGLLRGAGDNMHATLGSFVSIFVRVVSAYMLNPYLGIRSVWYGQAFGWIFGFLYLFIRYKTGKWKDKSVTGSHEAA